MKVTESNIRSNIKELAHYLYAHFNSLLIVLCALLSVTISLLFIGFIFRKLVDNGLGTSNAELINNSVYMLCSFVILFAISSFFRSYFINLIALKVTSKIKADTYKNLLQVEVKDFEEMKLGDIISRLSGDIEMINSLIINFLSFFIRNFIMLFGAMGMMFVQSVKLSSLVLISIPLLLIPLLKLSKHVRFLSRKLLDEQGLFISSIEESLAGIRTIYAYNRQEYILKQFEEKNNHNIDNSGKRLRLRSIFFALAISLIAIAITMVIWIGSIDIVQGKLTPGRMISFIYYAIITGMSAGGIAELFSQLQTPMAALDRVFEIKNLKIVKQNDVYPLMTNHLNGNIRYENVSFAYPARPDIQVLKDISLEIQHGIFTGIVGKSGSGKSTLFQLLIKFYECHGANKGNIFIGLDNIEFIPNNLLRSKIAYVEQNPTIFSGTIRSNIVFSNPECSEDELEQIIKVCGIDELVRTLNLGINTEIGEKGVRLSGGQKQRIAIARSILHKPDILLLDEALSALDSESETSILRELKKIMHDKTIILISHRISSIETADEILVVNHGKIAGKGTHFQLLEQCQIYNNLYKEQLTMPARTL